MKRCSRIAAVLAFATLLGGAAAFAQHDHEEHATEASLEPTEPASNSIYQLESLWTNSAGETAPLRSLAGRVQVIAMVYTHCEHACPRIILDMKKIGQALGDAGGRVGYALVSLDPERDTVDRLASFAEKTGLADQWTLLRADEGDVRELAAVLGIRYRRISEQDFVHSNLLSVVDPEGVVVHRQIGLGVDPDATVAKIREVLARGE